MDPLTAQEIGFSVFLFHKLAKAWGDMVPDVVHALSEGGIIHDYILPFYDVLHTLGEDYLVEDITAMARERGVLA